MGNKLVWGGLAVLLGVPGVLSGDPIRVVGGILLIAGAIAIFLDR